jgi:hypothetical protein
MQKMLPENHCNPRLQMQLTSLDDCISMDKNER